jgi:hypothetical protein
MLAYNSNTARHAAEDVEVASVSAEARTLTSCMFSTTWSPIPVLQLLTWGVEGRHGFGSQESSQHTDTRERVTQAKLTAERSM